MDRKKILIIGSGIGGLASALRLVKNGYEVEIVEKYYQPGGRINQIKKNGFIFDTGPSFFSMSYVFEELAKDCKIKLPFTYKELEPLSLIYFNNKKKIILYKDIKKLSEQFLEIEKNFEKKFQKYIQRSKELFDATFYNIIQKNHNSLFSYFFTLFKINPKYFPYLFRSFYEEVKRYFNSKEATTIFSLISFFLGKTPMETMAVYSLLSYIEFVYDGYYYVEGGMYKIIEGLIKELENEGVKFYYNTEIVDYLNEGNKIKYFIDQRGNKWQADVFLINSDAAYFRNKVLKNKNYSDEKLSKMDWTPGYLTIYLGIKEKLDNLLYHNYFLGYDFENYCKKLINDKKIPEKPYYYVNVLTKKNPELAPENCESLFFVCPVPNLIYKNNWEDKEKIVEEIINDFSLKIGKDIKNNILVKIIYTPEDWQNNFNLYKGSGLGLSHNFFQVGYFRPKNYDENFKNVFYVGSSTVPGAGIPMAIISSKLAFERIKNYFDYFK